MEMESGELVGRAMSYGIVLVDLPLRFGGPLWREEAGHQYLSAEGKQGIECAIDSARRERRQAWFASLGRAASFLGALTGLLAFVWAVMR